MTMARFIEVEVVTFGQAVQTHALVRDGSLDPDWTLCGHARRERCKTMPGGTRLSCGNCLHSLKLRLVDDEARFRHDLAAARALLPKTKPAAA